jgi:ribosomal protein S18 acetylase RimI-like enzyme
VDCKDGKGNIGLVGVHSDSRGKGQGSVLINAALNYFLENKCHRVSVVTQGRNQAACGLYEKFGFRVAGKTNFYHFWL